MLVYGKVRLLQMVKIEHVAIFFNDIEAAKEFFVKYLDGIPNEGYHNKKKGFRSYFLHFADGARLEIMNKTELPEGEKKIEQTGFSHIAFSLGSKEKVLELTETLRQDGYSVISGPRITGDGYFESCILDFEGNQIELTV